MSGVKIITEEIETDVVMLEDAKLKFVSLVGHGANRMPFRVIKSQDKKGGDLVDNLVIQALIVPDGIELSDIAGESGCEFLNDLNTSKTSKFDGFTKYEQLAESDFEDESFKLTKIGDSFAIVGELKDKEKTEGVVSISKEDSEKLGSIPTAPMDAVVDVVQSSVLPSFRDLFERELSSMLDVIYGSLKQSAVDVKQRSDTIIGAVDGFKRFLTIGLAAIGGNEVKFEDKKDIAEEKKGGDRKMLEFKTEEAFAEQVAGVVKPILKDFGVELLKELKGDTAEDGKEDANSNSSENEKGKEDNQDNSTTAAEDGNGNVSEDGVSKDMKDLVSTVKSLVEKVDSLAENPETERGSEEVHKDDDEEFAATGTDDSNRKKSPFSGLLVDYQHVRKMRRNRR